MIPQHKDTKQKEQEMTACDVRNGKAQPMPRSPLPFTVAPLTILLQPTLHTLSLRYVIHCNQHHQCTVFNVNTIIP